MKSDIPIGKFKFQSPKKEYRLVGKSNREGKLYNIVSEEDVSELPDDAHVYVIEHDATAFLPSSSVCWGFDLA